MRRKKVYLIVDGYNIINNWSELKSELETDLDSSRGKLIDILCEYAKMTDEKVIVVFDAHQVKGSIRREEQYRGIELIYTKENETADQYIERRLDLIGRREIVRVATSDAMIQRIILGRGGTRISASELKAIINGVKSNAKRIKKNLVKVKDKNLVRLEDSNIRLLDDLLKGMRKNSK